MGPTTIVLDINGILLAFFGSVTAIAAAFAAYQAAKGRLAAEEGKKLAIETRAEVKEVAKHSNSMKDELVKEVRAASLAKGAADQRNLSAGKEAEVTLATETSAVKVTAIPIKETVPKITKLIKKRPLGRKRK